MDPHVDERTGITGARRGRDARGRSVTLLDPYVLHLLRRHDVIPAAALHAIADEVGRGTTKWGARLYWLFSLPPLLGVLTIFVLKLVLRIGPGLDALGVGLWLLITVLYAVGLWGFLTQTRAARLKCVCAIMLRHRRCPHCGYDLRGLRRDPEDGAVLCPECGSAWRFDATHLTKHGSEMANG